MTYASAGRLRRGRAAVAIGTAVALAAPAAVSAEPPRPFGDARILARVPTPPGFPEGIAVLGKRVYVAGPATFGTTGSGQPSRVVAFDVRTGELVRTYPTQGEDVTTEHANSSIAFDGAGRLYVLNTQLGMYRLDVETGVQEPYSTPFPDLPPCPAADRCSPAPANTPPLPNDLAFDDAGNAYVTDSLQATIWRVPAGGGDPEVWFQDTRLASPYVGVNGIRLDSARQRVFLTVSVDLLGRGFVYTLPLADRPAAADLAVFRQYAPGDVPDGIAFGRSGRLYVALATPGTSGVSILDPAGVEEIRLGNPAGSPAYPYDSPANIAFDGKGSILLTNHAFATGVARPEQFTVLDVYVADKGAPLAG